MAVDIIAVGAHPDDVELGAGGIVAQSAAAGKRVVICDVTGGELSSQMIEQQRSVAAQQAAACLAAVDRICLGLPDRGIVASKDAVTRCVDLIRRLKPGTILLPDPGDRHPDHGAAYELWRQAIFSSGLSKFGQGAAHRPQQVFTYGVSPGIPPELCVDVSTVYEAKKKALSCYVKMFADGQFQATRSGNIELIIARDRYYGELIGVDYAEALRASGPMKLSVESF